LGETEQAQATLDELTTILRAAEGDFSAELNQVETVRQQLGAPPEAE
jgi:hypothetical protein